MKKPSALPRRLGGVLCLLALVLGFANTPARAQLTEPDFKQWSLIAIQDEGRVKPLDTYARETLLHLTGGSFLGMAVYKDTAGKVWQPNDFLLSILVSEAHDWKKEPLVLVNYRPLVQKLGLDATRKRFSFAELTQLPALDAMMRDIRALRSRDTDPQLSREQQEVESIQGRLVLMRSLLGGDSLLVVPRPPNTAAFTAASVPANATAGAHFAASTAWLVPSDEARNLYGPEKFGPVGNALGETLRAYQSADKFQFGVHSHELRDTLRALSPTRYPTDSALGLEYTYNHLGAFPWASVLYGVGAFFLLLHAGGQWAWSKWLGLAAGFSGLLLHAVGVVLRSIVAGRPPVTNMYESMIWVAFVAVAFGFVFYAIYRGTTFLLAALPVGCLLLLLTQQLPVAVPGTIEPLRPVLRDNFWLSTHVLTETASYGAFFLAWAFGHLRAHALPGKSGRGAAGKHASLLALPHAPTRRAAYHGGHDPGRRLGELLVGPLLGLGPEGNLGLHHAALLHRGDPRAHRRLVGTVRSGGGERGVFRRRGDGLVRGQLRPRQRAPLLRTRRGRRGLRGDAPRSGRAFPRGGDLASTFHPVWQNAGAGARCIGGSTGKRRLPAARATGGLNPSPSGESYAHPPDSFR